MSDHTTPRLSEVLEACVQGFLDDVRVALPGKVQSYDENGRRATVQVQLHDSFVDEDGVRQTAEIAILTDVPVLHWGGGAVRIKVPVKRGDDCLCIFASSSLAQLKAGASGPVDPGSDRHHHIADALALPVKLFGAAGDEPLIEFTTSGEIHAGGAQPLATKADVTALANFVNTLFVGGTGSVVVPPGDVPQPAGTTILKGG